MADALSSNIMHRLVLILQEVLVLELPREVAMPNFGRANGFIAVDRLPMKNWHGRFRFDILVIGEWRIIQIVIGLFLAHIGKSILLNIILLHVSSLLEL